MINKTIRKELQWLVGLLLLTTLLLGIIFGFNNLLDGELDTQVYDTYFVTTTSRMVFPFFTLLTFITYLFRQFIDKFKGTPGNYILLTATGILIILVTIQISRITIYSPATGGWIIYPPNAELPDPIINPDNFLIRIGKGLAIFQAVLVLALILVGVRTGKNLRART